ncbi:MAG: isopentenyl phosphate kinase family protein [Chloroflexi bacterium]|nr:isopentenyl phosphate kinase family protein [Chloroflexota bacterium]
MSEASQTQLIFLKLGGSLITDKNTPRCARMEVIQRLAEEISAALAQNPALRLLVGNGAGSFGHVPAKKYGTRQGVHTPEGWRGFAEVWRDAAALNHLVTEALHAAGLPAVAFPPSAAVTAQNGRVAAWDLQPLRAALDAGLLPVVHGDVIFDQARGGTILSTEDLFDHLALHMRPQRILLAGIESGVWADYPACTRLVDEITPADYAAVLPALGGSSATDVTGGMASKVSQSLALAQTLPGLEILIFSGLEAGQVTAALSGGLPGTLIKV